MRSRPASAVRTVGLAQTELAAQAAQCFLLRGCQDAHLAGDRGRMAEEEAAREGADQSDGEGAADVRTLAGPRFLRCSVAPGVLRARIAGRRRIRRSARFCFGPMGRSRPQTVPWIEELKETSPKSTH